jgi:hypothetical protein
MKKKSTTSRDFCRHYFGRINQAFIEWVFE